MNAKCASCKNFWGSSEEMKWDGYSIICKYCPDFEKEKESRLMLNHCIYCGITFHPGKWWWQEIETKSRQCMHCGKVTSMLNIKITAEVNGKQVPLETVSTETFEAIKALEKPKEIPIPVARTGNCFGANKRLILRTDSSLRGFIIDNDVPEIAINLETGEVMHWGDMGIYEDIKPL